MLKIKVLLVMSLMHTICFSQERKHIVLKTNSLNYVFSKGYNAALEIETKKNHSINTNFEVGDTRYANEKNKYIVLIVDRRSYFVRSKKQVYPSGFFVGPFIKYRYKDKNQPDDGPFLANKGVFQAHFLGLVALPVTKIL
jgi:thioredoxin-related protein